MGKTRWQNWVIALLGAWLIVSALFFGIDSATAAMWSAVIVGILLLFFIGWTIGQDHELLPKTVRPKDDLRGDQPEMAVPDEHEHMPVLPVHGVAEPGIVAPDLHVQAGETTKG
jgi:SPW repeat